MSCSHLNTRPLYPESNFGNTLHCMDCHVEFRVGPLPEPAPAGQAEDAKMKDQLLVIARDLREAIKHDLRGAAMDWAARRLEALAQ